MIRFFLVLVVLLIPIDSVWALEDSRDPKDWDARAQIDLDIAELTFQETNYYQQVCFLSHQAVEKKLKGMLWGQGIRPDRTHVTEDLYKRLIQQDKKFKVKYKPLRKLDSFYVPSQYPKPGYRFQEKDAETCLSAARSVLRKK